MGIIELKDIEKRYGDKIILKDINFNAEKGEFWIIKGSSGSGKSTFLNIIGLLDKPTKGDVIVSGQKNPKINSNKWCMLMRNKISYLFQNYGLMEDENVENNLEVATHFLGLKKEEKKKIMLEALDKVGLGDILKKKVYQLSGGEQQRVALAKCFIKKSEIILADEPTGNLDKDNRDNIMSIFRKLNEMGKTVIIVTHDSEIANYASNVLDFDV